MDCTRCAQMLDDPDRALAEAASRGDGATVDPCCRETLDLLRLERGVRRIMPMHEPHPSLDAIILKAAAARVAGATPVLAVAPAIVDPAPARSFVARLRSWVTAPQVAMATITALAVETFAPPMEQFRPPPPPPPKRRPRRPPSSWVHRRRSLPRRSPIRIRRPRTRQPPPSRSATKARAPTRIR